jgi:23S rRNA (cytidine2498-2'-O)-methyltransferase
MPNSPPLDPTSPSPWLIRVPEVFTGIETEILAALGAERLKKLGREFLLVRILDPALIRHSDAAKFLGWNLPVHHMWPCCPKDTPGFIEKAAQALWKKFGARNPQTILIGALDSDASNRYYRTLASNLRGRTLQLFPPQTGTIRDAEAQDANAPTLFCLVGEEGLFCGMESPQAANGFHPGGTKFIRQAAPGMISRAGAKIAEALHHLALYRSAPAVGSHWLELGASPGGMTSELLKRNYLVTAIDRAPLDARLAGASGLQAVCMDAARFKPAAGMFYDAILCDMNDDAREAIAQVVRLSSNLRASGLVVFTLKTPGVTTFAEINQLATSVAEIAAVAELRQITITHLTYNRHEFTIFFKRPA